MGNTQKTAVIAGSVLASLFYFGLITHLFLAGEIILEIYLLLVLLQILLSAFAMGFYIIHIMFKNLANKLKFHFITRFMEQPRMEGNYRDNWWQLHFASRAYGEYWGMPRTYVKLQFREEKKYNRKKLAGYSNYDLNGIKIDSIQHMVRPYKNYLLMKVKGYVMDKKKITALMDFLMKAEKESRAK